MRRIVLCSLFSILVQAWAKPGSDFSLFLAVDEQVDGRFTVQLVLVSPFAVDNVAAWLTLPDGADWVSGDISWHGNIVAGEQTILQGELYLPADHVSLQAEVWLQSGSSEQRSLQTRWPDRPDTQLRALPADRTEPGLHIIRLDGY